VGTFGNAIREGMWAYQKEDRVLKKKKNDFKGI